MRPDRVLFVIVVALASLLLAPSPAQAGDRVRERLDRALGRLAPSSEAEAESLSAPAEPTRAPADPAAEIRASLAELERRHAARKRHFEQVGARALPGKAADRLARAWEVERATHEELVRILKELLEELDPPEGAEPTNAGRVADLAGQARRILEKIESAARGEPLSLGPLRVAAPNLLATRAVNVSRAARAVNVSRVPAAQAQAGITDGPIAPVPAALKQAAEGLADPIAVYEWVRNNVRPEFYNGSMKGALQTYLEASGNDTDTASVLIALFRAKGLPARHVRGRIEVPGPTLAAMTGAANVEQAVRVLERAGIPNETVLGAGGVAAVRMERSWAEVYVPYADYRGAVLDSQGKVWLPLDPGFKRLAPPSGLDVVAELGLDARATLDEYLAEPGSQTPAEFTRGKVEEALAAQRPELTYADVLNQRGVVGEALGLLPSSLPYTVLEVLSVGYDPPDPLRHSVRFVGEANGALILDETFPVEDLLGRRLTLSYVPFGPDDQDVVESFGGMRFTPPYLFEVRPVLKSGGVAIAAGDGGVGMGVRFTFRMEFRSPGSSKTITNQILAGNLTAIGLGGREVTGSEGDTSRAAEILSSLARGYLDRWNRSDEELADLLKVVPVRPTVSACLVMSAIEAEYAGGDPQFPITFDWKGIAIDADLRSTAPVGVKSRDSERPFLLLSGLEGSILENRIFEDQLAIESVSTAKALQLAAQQGIAIHELTSANVGDVLPGLPLDPLVKAEIEEATARGLLARVPASELTHLAWTGVGYLLLDEETGEAAYQLQGGHSGGITAPAVIDIRTDLRDALVVQDETPADGPSDAARIQKFSSRDFQEGTVDKPVKHPLKVLVTDSDGYRVPKASVVFSVIGGGGRLRDPVTALEGSSIEVLSDDRGEVEVIYVLGRKTDLIPRFIQEEGEEHATQVGLNLITARAGSASLPEPFFAVGYPDDQFDGQKRYATIALASANDSPGPPMSNLTVPDRVHVSVTDPHGNPLSNIPVRFGFRPPPEQGTPPEGWLVARPPTNTPGHVLEAEDYVSCIGTQPSVRYGECPGEAQAVVVNSSALGAFAYPLIGDSPFSSYFYDIGPLDNPGLLSVWYGTMGPLCRIVAGGQCDPERSVKPTVLVSHGSRPVQVNALGNLIEAYAPGGTAEAGFWADLIYEKERIERWEGADGKVHFRAVGTNEWVREPLRDSEFQLTALTEGTGIPGAATASGDGRYDASMTLSSTPQLNTVEFLAKHKPEVIPYLPGEPNEVDPAWVIDGNPPTLRGKVKTKTWQGTGTFSLWGVKAEISEINRQDTFFPAVILLTENETTAYAIEFKHRVQPSEYVTLLDPRDVRFELRLANEIVMGGSGNDTAEPFTIPRDQPLKAGIYAAQLRLLGVSTGADGLEDLASDPITVSAGVVRLRLDANNDTVIDSEDDETLRQNPAATFAFWEADPNVEGLDRLQDFATVRIQMPFLLPEGQRLGLLIPGGNWVLRRKVEASNTCPDGSPGLVKGYLCDKETAERQLDRLDVEDGQPIKRGGDQYAITSDMLRVGDNDFLFQCMAKMDGSPGCGEQPMILSHLTGILPLEDLPVGTRRTDVRPLNSWMSAYSARNANGFSPRPVAVAEEGWAEIPRKAATINVLVHGFNVAADEARNRFLPLYFKRLYWVGVPVFAAQQDTEGGLVHTVGFIWPGDEGDEFSPLYFPEDEFHALQTGVAFSRLLKDVIDKPSSRRINVLAHSLGNMVVNSALMQPGMDAVIDNYVMNEAAIPAEAFDSGYVLSADDRKYMLSHAERHGFSENPDVADQVWDDQWELLRSIDFRQQLQAWQAAVDSDSHLKPKPSYEARWRQSRPNGPLVPSEEVEQPRRGPWKGLFAENVRRVGRFVNTFNTADQVLSFPTRSIDEAWPFAIELALVGLGPVAIPVATELRVHAWYLCQQFMKPRTGALADFEPFTLKDDVNRQLWARLHVSAAEEEYLWGSTGNHSNITRQWAELAYWFPAVSGAAGSQALSTANVINEPFTDYGASPPGLLNTSSHTYLGSKPLHEVWGAYGRLAHYLQ